MGDKKRGNIIDFVSCSPSLSRWHGEEEALVGCATVRHEPHEADSYDSVSPGEECSAVALQQTCNERCGVSIGIVEVQLDKILTVVPLFADPSLST